MSPVDDPSGPPGPSRSLSRAWLGRAWRNPPWAIRPAYRSFGEHDVRTEAIGFRVVR